MTAASPRTKLGSWQCPTGNSCDAFVWRDGAGLVRVTVEWATPPPLRAADELYYRSVILPAIYRHLAERLEVPAAQILGVRLKEAP